MWLRAYEIMRPRILAERAQEHVSVLLASNSRAMKDQDRTSFLADLDRASAPYAARRRAPRPTAAFMRDLTGAARRSAAGHPPVQKGGEQ